MDSRLLTIGIFSIVIISGCVNLESLPNSQSSDEEICSSIENDKLRNQCLAYVNDNPDLCQEYGCYALAVKQVNENVCTNDGWDDSEGKCLSIVAIAKNQSLDIELMKKFQLNCKEIGKFYDERNTEAGDCSSIDICDIQNTECYGMCDVWRSLCIQSVAVINNNPDYCELSQVTRSSCYYRVGSYTRNIELCNKISPSDDLTRERCYFNVVADSLEIKYNYIIDN